MFLGRRGYYLERSYQNEPSFGMHTLTSMVEHSVDKDRFLEYIKTMNVTHILMRTDLVDNFLHDSFSQEEIIRLRDLVNNYWQKIYADDRYILWGVGSRPMQ
jgi:hypothetical protein